MTFSMERAVVGTALAFVAMQWALEVAQHLNTSTTFFLLLLAGASLHQCGCDAILDLFLAPSSSSSLLLATPLPSQADLLQHLSPALDAIESSLLLLRDGTAAVASSTKAGRALVKITSRRFEAQVQEIHDELRALESIVRGAGLDIKLRLRAMRVDLESVGSLLQGLRGDVDDQGGRLKVLRDDVDGHTEQLREHDLRATTFLDGLDGLRDDLAARATTSDLDAAKTQLGDADTKLQGKIDDLTKRTKKSEKEAADVTRRMDTVALPKLYTLEVSVAKFKDEMVELVAHSTEKLDKGVRDQARQLESTKVDLAAWLQVEVCRRVDEGLKELQSDTNSLLVRYKDEQAAAFREALRQQEAALADKMQKTFDDQHRREMQTLHQAIADVKKETAERHEREVKSLHQQITDLETKTADRHEQDLQDLRRQVSELMRREDTMTSKLEEDGLRHKEEMQSLRQQIADLEKRKEQSSAAMMQDSTSRHEEEAQSQPEQVADPEEEDEAAPDAANVSDTSSFGSLFGSPTLAADQRPDPSGIPSPVPSTVELADVDTHTTESSTLQVPPESSTSLPITDTELTPLSTSENDHVAHTDDATAAGPQRSSSEHTQAQIAFADQPVQLSKNRREDGKKLSHRQRHRKKLQAMKLQKALEEAALASKAAGDGEASTEAAGQGAAEHGDAGQGVAEQGGAEPTRQNQPSE